MSVRCKSYGDLSPEEIWLQNIFDDVLDYIESHDRSKKYTELRKNPAENKTELINLIKSHAFIVECDFSKDLQRKRTPLTEKKFVKLNDNRKDGESFKQILREKGIQEAEFLLISTFATGILNGKVKNVPQREIAKNSQREIEKELNTFVSVSLTEQPPENIPLVKKPAAESCCGCVLF